MEVRILQTHAVKSFIAVIDFLDYYWVPVFCLCLASVSLSMKYKSENTKKGPGTFDNCELNNSVEINSPINNCVLVNLKDIGQSVLVLSV